jgi:hypothetical protein
MVVITNLDFVSTNDPNYNVYIYVYVDTNSINIGNGQEETVVFK